MLQGEPRYARMAEELVLRKDPVKGNHLLYHKTLADYYRSIEKYKKMLPHVLAALDHEKLKDERAKLYYILGQLYRKQGNEEEAYVYFSKAQKRNPPYILQFNAKLSELAVIPFNTQKDKKHVKKAILI